MSQKKESDNELGHSLFSFVCFVIMMIFNCLVDFIGNCHGTLFRRIRNCKTRGSRICVSFCLFLGQMT